MSMQESSVYPQANPFKQGELEALMARPLVAKLCTHNPDGTIHIAPLYFGYEDGEVLLGTQDVTQKVRNIERDNRVTVLIDDASKPLQGMIMYGTARLQYEDAIPTRARIFTKYMDEEGALGFAQQLASKWEPVVVRVKPDNMITFNYAHGLGIEREGA